tara:strand:- start:234 stop:2282 length:2049 start_codon:yes stop_codon:yes gene_type:complete
LPPAICNPAALKPVDDGARQIMSSKPEPNTPPLAAGPGAGDLRGTEPQNRDGELLRAVLNSSLDAIIVADQDSKIISFNNGAEKIFGYAENEVVGQAIEILIPENLRALHKRHVAGFLGSERDSLMMAGRSEIEGLRRDGRKFPAAASVTRLPLGSGTLVCVILRDISESVARQNDLRDLKDQAVAASQAKSRFLATMSHEIRSPLHGVLGMIQLLKLGATTERQKQQIAVAEQSGTLLLDLINDAIDLSKVEAGFLELKPEPFDLRQLLEGVVSGYRSAAAGKAIGLHLQIDTACAEMVIGDPLRLRQVLTNLIGNAVKFTEQGRVEVQVRPDGEDRIHFMVSDTGIGLSPEDSELIFNRFLQADPSIERKFGGSGLGLSIVRELVALMSGELGLDSDVGVGSNFWVSIPLVAQDTAVQHRPGRQLADPVVRIGVGKVALVVDDLEANRLVCASMLETLGFEAILCGSGTEALKLLRKHPIDLVFLDLHMPLMAGTRCVREIRREQAAWSEVPIVILTADTTGNELDAALAAGAGAYCFKPFNLSELAQASQQLIAASPSRLILIDDDPVEHQLLASLCDEVPGLVKLEYFPSADAFCRSGDADPSAVILLDGRIPPISRHKESLDILAAGQCQANIYLLSSEKGIECPEIPGLKIISVIDKLELYRPDQLNRFLRSLDNL